jgi:hypothetical protein
MVASFFLDLQHRFAGKDGFERTDTNERHGKEIPPTTKEVGIEYIKVKDEAYGNASTSRRANERSEEWANQ